MENIFSFVGTSLRKRKRRRQSRVEKANFDFCDPGCSVNNKRERRQGSVKVDGILILILPIVIIFALIM